jgi:two-component system sensor kinase FixL
MPLLRRGDTLYRLLVENVKDYAIFALDPEGRVMSWSLGAERVMGWSEEEAFGRDFALFYLEDERRRGVPAAHLREAAEAGRIEVTGWRITRDGRRFWAETVITALREPDGELAGFAQITRDLTERRRAEEALRISEAKFSGIVSIAADAIISMDARQRITLFNEGAERIFGYSPEEVLGRPLDVLLPERFRARHRELVDEFGEGPVAARRMGERREIYGLRKGGEEFPAEASISRLEVEGERIYAVVLRDITERKRIENALARQREELIRSNRELEQFATIASHDLQEPLRKIQAFGDRLAHKYADALAPEGRDYLERMQGAARRMQVLIQDLLTFSRITTKAQPFTPVDLGEVAREVVSDLEMRVEQTGGSVEIGPLPTIDADPLQMRQLLQNLVGNALKFHKEDVPPRVEISAETTADGLCRLRVADNGIGFDEKYLDRIFGVFQRLHGREAYEGTGVGLAICRKIAERHGGSITATSVPGRGSTFIVTLPVRQPKQDLAR